jgi:hypothetical protein
VRRSTFNRDDGSSILPGCTKIKEKEVSTCR